MAMSDYSLSDIAAVSDGNGFGGDGNGGWWILLLFILLGGRGWGGYGNGGGAGSVGGNELYPWMESQSAMANGFANLTNAVTSGFANAETAATARQMADMQQAFGLSQQFAECCCENRLGLANLTSVIQSEGAADRMALSDGIRDVLAAQNAGTQRIIDQLCQDKIDAKNDEIAQLRTQIQVQNLAASQNAQTAAILADNARQTTALEQYLNPTPVPAYQVANPNCCTQNWSTCGCGI